MCVSEFRRENSDLLLAEAESSTQLWQTQPEAMAAALARLERGARDHRRPRWCGPVKQGPDSSGADGFLPWSPRAADAHGVWCRVCSGTLAPIQLRIASAHR